MDFKQKTSSFTRKVTVQQKETVTTAHVGAEAGATV